MTEGAAEPALAWLTGLSGLSGAGKCALAQGPDSDALRQGLCVVLGFSPEDRAENIRRTAEVGLLMRQTRPRVSVALISPNAAAQAAARALAQLRQLPGR